jgi:hypothetical protein
MRIAAMTLAALVALAAPAGAQQACPGHISATAISPVPAGARIAVSLRDDSPSQIRLRDAVYARLQGAGHPTGTPAAFTLSWRGSLNAERGPVGATRSDTMFSRQSRFQDSDDLSWMRDVPRTARRPGIGPVRLTGSVELREVASRRVVWTAVFSCDRRDSGEAALIETLAGAVVPIIGQTVAGRPF